MRLRERWTHQWTCPHCGTWWEVMAEDLRHDDDGQIGAVCADCLRFNLVDEVPPRLVESVRNTHEMLYPHPDAPSRKK